MLLRRLCEAAELYGLEVAAPIRRTRSELVREDALRAIVRRARMRSDVRALLILFDADDDCPVELRARIEAAAREEAAPMPCAVVVAQREFEAWLLAALDSLRGHRGIREDAVPHPDPEAVRDAKGQIERFMERGTGYSETRDQVKLTARFDMEAAFRRCRSFRRMVRAFGLVAEPFGLDPAHWPPASWRTE